VIIAVGNDAQFGKLCGVLGEPGLAQQPAYRTNVDRMGHRAKLIAHLCSLTSRMARDELLEKLEAVGVPSGPINRLDQVFADPQVIERGMQINPASKAAKGGKIPGVRTPIMVDGKPMAAKRPSPRLGEHTAEILREIGEAKGARRGKPPVKRAAARGRVARRKSEHKR
jgi:crotonobetainyl-CoA:carnitine CoA-transferase CaiB-like acyl-CoA transferase